MPVLAFKVQADYEKVLRLREEIHKLKEEMKGVDAVNNPHQFNVLNQKIKQSVDEYNKLTEVAAKAGAQIGVASRKQIYDAQQAVNSLTEDIIKQKKIIAETSDKLKVLTDKYKELKRNGQNIAANSMLPDINKAKKALDEEKFALFDLTQERAKVQLGVKKLREEYALFAKESGASTSIIAKMNSEIMGLGAGMLAGFGLKELGAEIIRVRGQFQQADTAIQTLLGSKEKADALLTKVREYAKISTLEFGDITSATQMMLGFNIEAEKVPGFIKAIGDVSMGEAGRFNSLTLAFSQMSATGKLMGQDLNQMINAGFNPLSVMAEKTGKSVAQLKEEMSKGAITAEMVQQAFIDATSEGGKFFNMSQNAAKTINGQLSMMHDAIDTALNDIGKDSEGVIVDAISGVTKLIENYETLGRVLIGLTATYGTYRTAVALVTFAENGHTLAMTLARAQILLTQKAQALLNTTMLANPYVLAATAIAGLVSAMVLYKKSADEATLVNEKLNKSFGATQAEIVSEQKKIDDLFDKLRKAEVGTNEYKQIKDTILNQYGSYLEGLNNEIATLKDVEGAYKAVAAAARDAALARGRDAALASANSDYNQKYSEYIGKIYDQLIKKGFNENDTKRMLGWIQGDLKKTGKVAEDTQRALHKYGVEFSWFGELNKAESGLSYETQKINAMFGEQGKVVDETSKKVSKLSEDYKAAERSFRNAKNWLKQIEKNKSDYTTEEYKKALQDYEAKKKAFKDVGGDPDKKKNGGGRTGTKEDIVERVRVLNDKQITAQLRAAKDLEFSTREAEIKAMQDGMAKRLAQIELNKDKEMEAISRSYEDLRINRINEAKKLWDADPKNKGKNFYDSDSYKYAAAEERYTSEQKGNKSEREKAVQAEYIDSLTKLTNEYQLAIDQRAEKYKKYSDDIAAMTDLRNKAEEKGNTEAVRGLEDRIKLAKVLRDLSLIDESMENYNQLYGTWSQKLEATNSKYKRKISEANARGDTGLAMSLQKEWEDAVANLDIEKLKEKINWEVVFGNLTNVSTKKLKEVKKQMDAFISSAKFKKMSPNNQKAIIEAFTQIKAELNERGGIFQGLIEATKEYHTALDELRTATEEYDEAVKQFGEDSKEAQEKLKKKNAAEKKAESSGGNVKDSLDKTIDKVRAISNMAQAMSTAGDDAVGALGSVFDTIAMLLGDKGGWASIVAGILEILDMIGEKGLAGFLGDVLGGVAHAIGGIVETIGNIFGASGWGDIFMGADTRAYDDMVAKYDALIDVWDTLLDKKKEYISMSYGAEAVNASKEAELIVKREIAAWRELGKERLNAGASMGSHSYGVRSRNNMTDEEWKAVARSLGRSTKDWAGLGGRLEGLFDLSVEQLEKLRQDVPTFWAKLDSDVQEYLNKIIDGYGRIEDLQKSLMEQMTSTTFDALKNNFSEALYDMEGTAEERGKKIKDALFKSIVDNFILGKDFDNWLESFYKKWAEKIGGGSMSAYDWNQYAKEYNEMLEQKIAERDKWAASMGYTGNGSGSGSDQTATASMAEKATYDQFDTYLGIATAQQIALEQIKDSISGMTGEGLTLANMNLEQILSISSAHRDIADESRDILAKSYLELQEANEHLGKIEKSVDRIEASVSKTEHLINDRL